MYPDASIGRWLSDWYPSKSTAVASDFDDELLVFAVSFELGFEACLLTNSLSTVIKLVS